MVLPHLIAVDWGTSSLRGARLDEAGRVLEEKSAPLGILNVPNGDFAGVFAAQFSDWMKPGTPCLISGMAGSRQGWAEAPYVACPAGPDELARHLHWIERDRIALVPGLSDTQGEVPDVMRGEEVQIFGAMRLAGLADGLFVLPGTHSKWAVVRGGRVIGFSTFMTGEVYGLFAQHSILARTLDANARSTTRPSGAVWRGRLVAKACCITPLACGRWACSTACRPPSRRAISPGC